MHRDGDRLVIEPLRKRGLLALLKTMEPLDVSFPEIDDPVADPDKYPWIVDSLLSLRVRSIIVDGEAAWAGKDGKSDFDKLHSNAHDDQVFLYGFDLLELNGED
jgi:hypothetical protein